MLALRNEYSIVTHEIRKIHESQIEKRSKKLTKELEQQETKIANRINSESFGREHFFREIGLQYYFGTDQNNQARKLEFFVEKVAELMIKGYAIELMDGDNLFIWTKWIEKILTKLEKAIQTFIGMGEKEPRGISISIMGL